MNEIAKTGAFVGGAAVLCLLAMMTGPHTIKHEQFSDEGQEFFADFKDPNAATDLEVWEFREATSQIVPFSVKRNDKGLWTVPSHYDYPADAKDRMAKAAAMLVGLRKDRVRSDLKDDHALLGVVDPKEENLELKGRGMRVTFKDNGGKVLADLIVGKAVEGKTDTFYVRIPDKKRTYAAKFQNQLSTKFADWIETDLLKAQSWDITKVMFNNYTVDEQAQAIKEGEKIVAKKDDASKWTLDGLTAEEQANEDKLREVGDSLGQIKIVGVRQKPPGLTGALRLANGIEGLAQAQDLQRKGYFPTRDGTVVSNEGELIFETRKGIRYTLRFGEVAPGEGDALTAGKDEPKPQAPTDGQPGPQPQTGNHRYLMVTAEFDESTLKPPTGLRLPEDELKKRAEARTAIEAIVKAVDAFRDKNDKKLPESLAKLCEKPADGAALLAELKKDPWDGDYALRQQGETYAVVSFGADKAENGDGAAQDVRSDAFAKEDDLRRAADEWKAHDKKIEDGKKEATSLGKRFGPWYYVIDNTLFTKLKPARKDLVKPKEKAAEAAAGTTPPANGGGTGPVK